MNIPLARPFLGNTELEYVKDCIKTKWISSLGKYVTEFEENFSGYCQCRYGVSTCNGTAALHLILKILGIGKGDEVIIPNLTFVATANAVSYLGAKPVFADSERLTWNVDPSDIERRINRKTRAIIVVHLYGHPAQMDRIVKIARKYKLFVIEDACEAHGALYKNRRVGSIGDAAIFSFYGNKIITTGEGGMIVTNSRKICERARFLRDHAMSRDRKYFHPEVGFNYRLTNVQAAIGVAQFKKIDHMIERKIGIAERYNTLLKDDDSIVLPPDESWAKSVYWMYSILVDTKGDRDRLIGELRSCGVETRPFFIPMNRLPPYRGKERFPVSEDLAVRGVNLPCFVDISDKEIGYVCRKVKDILKRGKK